MAQLIQLRRGTAAEWFTADPVLAEAEFGLDSDTWRLKLGDGTNPWSSLPYVTSPTVYTFDHPGPLVAGIKTLYRAANITSLAYQMTLSTSSPDGVCTVQVEQLSATVPADSWTVVARIDNAITRQAGISANVLVSQGTLMRVNVIAATGVTDLVVQLLTRPTTTPVGPP